MKLYPKIVRYFTVFGFAAVGLTSFYFGMHFATQELESRAPAALPRRYDFSNLTGDELKVAAQDRLLRGAKIVTAGTSVGIQLGNFQMRDSQTTVVGACDHYNQIELVFYAGDMAVSGEPPTMVMIGPCESSDDGDEISPLMLDYMTIVKLPVFDRELRPGKSSLFFAKFTNVSDAWPKLWVLQSVKLQNTQQASQIRLAQNAEPQREPQQQSPNGTVLPTLREQIFIDGRDIRRILGKSISIEWP